MTTNQIAAVCHAANMAFCIEQGDHSQKQWGEAEQWQRDSAIKGVSFRYSNPTAPASAQHEAWLADKLAAGWKYGATKDPAKKEHPCCVSYDLLPSAQQAKDALFCGVCDALKPLWDGK